MLFCSEEETFCRSAHPRQPVLKAVPSPLPATGLHQACAFFLVPPALPECSFCCCGRPSVSTVAHPVTGTAL